MGLGVSGRLDSRLRLLAVLRPSSQSRKLNTKARFPVFSVSRFPRLLLGVVGVGPASHRKEKPRTGRQTHPGACRSALGAVVGKKVVFDFTSMSRSSRGDGTQTRNGASLPPNPRPFSDFMGLKKKKDSILFCWNADFL